MDHPGMVTFFMHADLPHPAYPSKGRKDIIYNELQIKTLATAIDEADGTLCNE